MKLRVNPNESLHFVQTVHLLIPLPPFQLMISLSSLELCREHLTAQIAPSHLQNGETIEDFENLVTSQPELILQISHSHEHLGTPVIPCYLSLCQNDSHGLQLRFSFTKSDLDLDALIEAEQMKESIY
tara:strand:- start:1040 stop:1423 length:384 start_codon:yes stop_codon:yes gene_type:complete